MNATTDDDQTTGPDASETESTSTMTDLRSSHRMMKTGCIIFFPLGLTSLIATLSLVYITAMHDRHSVGPRAATSAAERRAADVHDAATTSRWVWEVTPVHSAPDTRRAMEDQVATSLSPFYDKEGDLVSRLGNLTRGIATAPSIGSSTGSARTGWLAVAASSKSSMTTRKGWFAVSTRRKSTRPPKVVSTVRSTHTFLPTGPRIHVDSLDNEDIDDINDNVQKGKPNRTSRNAVTSDREYTKVRSTRSFPPTGQRIDVDSLDNEDINDINDKVHKGKPRRTSRNAATSDREYTETTDLLDLLGVLDTSAPLVNLSGSAKRAHFTKKAVHDVTGRRYRLQSTRFTRLSCKGPSVGGRNNKLVYRIATHAMRARTRRLPLFKRSTTTTKKARYISTKRGGSAAVMDFYE